MHRILCSTGALIGRPNGRDYRLLSGCPDRLRCDGYEFMMYGAWYEEADRLFAFLHGLGLCIPVVHCEKQLGESFSEGPGENWDRAMERFEINCQLAHALGAQKLVLHLWNGIPSDQKIENNLRAYRSLKETAVRHGLALTIENVVCNASDPMTHWLHLFQIDPAVQFTFDTKMAAFHGQMDAVMSEESRWLWDRSHITHLHLNDYSGGYMDWQHLQTLHIGRGHIDFDRFFRFLSSVHYQGDYTVEATSFLPDGVIRWEDLNETFSKIRSYQSS
ncbi:MAG: sugar phosphate isomerase/epimerase [Clostridia bacterium]|nr:sugar phosphate isomerase/epimerase [Clostridia bacterium]